MVLRVICLAIRQRKRGGQGKIISVSLESTIDGNMFGCFLVWSTFALRGQITG